MINLIGCSKDNFFKLLELMNYKLKNSKEKNEELFVYKPKIIRDKKIKKNKKATQENPFQKLSEIRFR